MRKRGIEDLDTVQIDPWPAGSFGLPHEDGRRICRCLAYVRDTPEDNGYAKPVEGVIAFVDMARGEVLEVVDHGVVPIPPENGSYLPEDQVPARRPQPLEIVQPEGPSFTVEGNLISWQKWSLRVAIDPSRASCSTTSGYEDDGRVRPILHRASVTEMVVPYGEPGPMHGWKNAFDAGEWGLGRMANSLVLGCDCLGRDPLPRRRLRHREGQALVLKNAICIHEEDYGILWKHVDLRCGRTEVRRSRRLVVSSISTVGNYEYGFYWYFYLDGTMQFEVKLTGILSTMAVAPGEHARVRVDDRPPTGRSVPPAPVQRAPRRRGRRAHQLGVRGRRRREPRRARTTRWTTPSSPRPPSSRPRHGAPARASTRRAAGAGRSSTPRSTNRLGNPVAYKLVPGSTPTLLADPASSVAKRAGFATKNLWVTPYDPTSGEPPATTPTSTPGATACPAWTARTAPSSTTTSSSGTPSASRTCRDPRTGPSCPSSTPGSRSCRRASSTAIPPLTFPRPRPPAHD